jgi:hypothetical protein
MMAGGFTWGDGCGTRGKRAAGGVRAALQKAGEATKPKRLAPSRSRPRRAIDQNSPTGLRLSGFRVHRLSRAGVSRKLSGQRGSSATYALTIAIPRHVRSSPMSKAGGSD